VCHAEKRLIAFFVNKHVFLPQELEKLDLEGLSDMGYEQREGQAGETEASE
jgi:hypothetical protein